MNSDDCTPLRSAKREKVRIDFANIVTPKNMRSHFWAFFGYPADENEKLITKGCVVCTLCHKVIPHHNNTTNLRAHVQSTHKEEFRKLCQANHIIVPPRRSNKVKFEPAKFESEEQNNDSCSDSDYIDESENILIENYFSNGGEAEPYNDGSVDVLAPMDAEISYGESVDTKEQITIRPIMSVNLMPEVVKIEANPRLQKKTDKNLHSHLLRMIVKDLKPVSVISEEGFLSVLRFVTDDDGFCPLEEITNSLLVTYEEAQSKLKSELIEHACSKPFSLGFEIWENIEQKLFLNTYFNYVEGATASDPRFKCVLFDVAEYTEHFHMSAVLNELNLKNCSAAVCDGSSANLEAFLTENDIPYIHCFKNVINRCLRDVFAVEGVSRVLDDVHDILLRHSNILQAENVEIPLILDHFPWTKYQFLKFFTENVSWPDEMNADIEASKLITDALAPLEITIETISEDQNPLGSLMQPLTQKLIEKHYVEQEDVGLYQEIKLRIKSTLMDLVMSNTSLTTAALLDPRFHIFLDASNLEPSRQMVRNAAKERCIAKSEPRPEFTSDSSDKKSNFSYFFDNMGGSASKRLKEDNIDWDLRRYQSDAYAELDHSSLVWWSNHGYMYGGLRSVAEVYNCIPCCANFNFKMSLIEQIKYYNQRYNLTGIEVPKILYLHLHNYLK